MYLLDTDILSLLRRIERAPTLARWIETVSDEDVYLSTITIGEVARGTARQRSVNPAFADDLHAWLDRVVRRYSSRILPIGIAEARCWGDLSARIGNTSADLMIAATALVHDLTVVTGNTRHYTPTGARILDPTR